MFNRAAEIHLPGNPRQVDKSGEVQKPVDHQASQVQKPVVHQASQVQKPVAHQASQVQKLVHQASQVRYKNQ